MERSIVPEDLSAPGQSLDDVAAVGLSWEASRHRGLPWG